jgi:hypothetical protein
MPSVRSILAAARVALLDVEALALPASETRATWTANVLAQAEALLARQREVGAAARSKIGPETELGNEAQHD